MNKKIAILMAVSVVAFMLFVALALSADKAHSGQEELTLIEWMTIIF